MGEKEEHCARGNRSYVSRQQLKLIFMELYFYVTFHACIISRETYLNSIRAYNHAHIFQQFHWMLYFLQRSSDLLHIPTRFPTDAYENRGAWFFANKSRTMVEITFSFHRGTFSVVINTLERHVYRFAVTHFSGRKNGTNVIGVSTMLFRPRA